MEPVSFTLPKQPFRREMFSPPLPRTLMVRQKNTTTNMDMNTVMATNENEVVAVHLGAFYLLTFLLEGKAAEPVVIALYAGAMILSGYTTFLRGLRNLTRFKFNMDTLMTVALIGAVIIGEWREATLVAILFGLNERWKATA